MKIVSKATAILCIALLFFTSCEEKKKEKNNEDSETSSTAKAQTTYDLADAETIDSTCACLTDWFPHTQTPAPAEGKGSPFDASSTTNCIFHQWSWQKFLWLTKPDGDTPLFLKETIQVDPYMSPVTIPSGVSLVLTSSEAEQAGSSGILKSNPNFNANGKSGTVYYAIYMNDIMNTAAKEYAAQIASGKLQPANSQAFPVGSFELKTSWVSTEVIPESERGNYYTTNASIDGTTTEVAMLGMHVVGVVENHPEFIWATFEHNSLAPAFDWTTGTASADSETLLFKKGSTSSIDGIYWNSKTGAPNAASEAYILFEYGVPRVQGAPDSNFMETSQSEPLNYNNIQNINNCVAENLSDVWNNYAYSGSIWVNTDGLTPAEQVALLKNEGYNLGKATPGSVTRGSVNAANITMETYTQTFNSSLSSIDASNLANCLSCHNAKSFSGNQPTSPLYISHVFNGYLESQKGTSKKDIKLMKVKDFQEAYIDKQ
ncbi:hypothetical protein [Kordia zhangzhouensis]|uniref:hypothetical protein n=1 Tax=Kordia zhangzhouensis TaxID=1620405 RepID=UPI00069AC86C|nr:hypothetical protein [Kordia zhangzhouensis]